MGVGLTAAMILVAVYSLLAVVLYLLPGKTDVERRGIGLGSTLVAYLIGGLIAGPLVGALAPLARWPVGAAFLGFLSLLFVDLAFMSVLVPAAGGSVSDTLWLSLAVSVMVGCPVGLYVARELRKKT